MTKRAATIEINEFTSKKVKEEEKEEEVAHFEILYDEILCDIMSFCGGYAFVAQFVCKRWLVVFRKTYMPLHVRGPWKKTFRQPLFSLKEAGHFSVPFAKWAFERMSRWHSAHPKFAEYAALAGNEDLVKWLVLTQCKWNVTTQMASCAAQGGSIKLLRWLRDAPYGVVFSQRITVDAVKGGHIDVLKWLMTLKTPWNLDGFTNPFKLHETSYADAAKRRDLKMLEWLKEKGCIRGMGISAREPIEEASRRGYLDVLKWLFDNKHATSVCAPYYAAQNGHMDALQYLRDNGCPESVLTAVAFAERGDLKMLKEYDVTRSVPRYRIVNAAIRRGHVHVVKWLKEKQGCDLDVYDAYVMAVESGNVEMLTYLREQGVPFERVDRRLFVKAIAHGDLDMLEWLYKEDVVWATYSNASKRLGIRGNIDILKWTKENHLTIDVRVTSRYAAMRGYVDVLDWLSENYGLEMLDKCMCDTAVKRGHIEVLQWALRKGFKMTKIAYCHAVGSNRLHVGILRWLKERDHTRGTPFKYSSQCYCHSIDQTFFNIRGWKGVLECPCSHKENLIQKKLCF